jgi:excisionase family DNA binding protein
MGSGTRNRCLTPLDKKLFFVYTKLDKHRDFTLMTSPAKIIRVSVSEAAKLFGVSTRTVRRAVAEGHLGYVVVRGRYKINFESLVKWSQGRPTVRNKLASTGIGQYVEHWKIRNKLYSPNPKLVTQKEDEAPPIDGSPETR